jgi:hypothetical protein
VAISDREFREYLRKAGVQLPQMARQPETSGTLATTAAARQWLPAQQPAAVPATETTEAAAEAVAESPGGPESDALPRLWRTALLAMEETRQVLELASRRGDLQLVLATSQILRVQVDLLQQLHELNA